MKAVRFSIPQAKHDTFIANWKTWMEAKSASSVPLAPWSAGEPFATTNTSSDVVLACQVDNSFFEQFPEWKQHVIH